MSSKNKAREKKWKSSKKYAQKLLQNLKVKNRKEQKPFISTLESERTHQNAFILQARYLCFLMKLGAHFELPSKCWGQGLM